MSTVAAKGRVSKPTRWEEPQEERLARRARLRAALSRLALGGAVVGSLVAVVSRQTVGYEREREVNALRAELSVAEAERVELSNRIQSLQTRARITRVAQQRLGMHVARDEEIVMLPIPASTASSASTESAESSASAERAEGRAP